VATMHHLRHHRLAEDDGRSSGRRERQPAIKSRITDLSRVFLRVVGDTKMTVRLGFALAALNPRPDPELPG